MQLQQIEDPNGPVIKAYSRAINSSFAQIVIIIVAIIILYLVLSSAYGSLDSQLKYGVGGFLLGIVFMIPVLILDIISRIFFLIGTVNDEYISIYRKLIFIIIAIIIGSIAILPMAILSRNNLKHLYRA